MKWIEEGYARIHLTDKAISVLGWMSIITLFVLVALQAFSII